MPCTEERVDELIKNVRRDFALGRFLPRFWQKLRDHGLTIGFLNPRNNIFVAWSSEGYPTRIKSCFIATDGLGYLLRQPDIEVIRSPK